MFPPLRWRFARPFSIQGWRLSSQSSMPSISLPVTGPSPSRVPRLVDAVSGSSARAVASFEAGSTTRATTAATARSRVRSALRPRTRASPSARSVPSTAATCPCGSDRRMATAAPGDGNVTPPARAARTASTRAGGILDRLATVRLRTRFPSRHASRSRTAGGEERLGMVSTLRATGRILTWQHVSGHNMT